MKSNFVRVSCVFMLLFSGGVLSGCGEPDPVEGEPEPVENHNSEPDPVENDNGEPDPIENGDDDPPQTQITQGPDLVTLETTATFEFSANDDNAEFECQLNASGWEACGSPHTVAGLAPAEYAFTVRATVDDLVEEVPPTWEWMIVDSTETVITEHPDSMSNDPDPRFEFANPIYSTFECRLNQGDWEQCDSPVTFSELPDGDHLFEVRAIDEDEAVESPVEYFWTIHTVAPITTILQAPEQVVEETEATIEFEADDPDAAFQCRLNGQNWEDCESPWELIDLEMGEQTFEVRATDVFGNIETPPAFHVWEIYIPLAWVDVAAGRRHVCGVTEVGELYCWGYNRDDQVGVEQEDFWDYRPSPQQVGDDSDWSQVAAGPSHSCGIRDDGTLWCWGSQRFGALGNGVVDDESTHIPQQVGDEEWVYVTAGGSDGTFGYDLNTCGIRDNGTLWCWGYNYYGQLGQGDTQEYDTPQQVGDEDDWETVDVADNSVCGIRSGELYCWGHNPSPIGHSGHRLPIDNDNTVISTPHRVGEESDWTDIALGDDDSNLGAITEVSHGCGIRSGGLYCWGEFPAEEIGVIHQIGDDQDWTVVRAAHRSTCALRQDQTLWCFGQNANDMLGIGVAGDILEPQQVGDADDWATFDIASHSKTPFVLMGVANEPHLRPSRHLCGIRGPDSEMRCWGRNTFGELGQGELTWTADPTLVDGNLSWDQLAVGLYNTCGIDTDGDLRCWGYNADTNLDQGVQATPQIYGDGNWSTLAASSLLNCAINSAQELWCWGHSGNNGLFGDVPNDGFPFYRVVEPTQIAASQQWKSVSTSASPAAYSRPYLCAIDADDLLWCWGSNSDGQLGDNTTDNRYEPGQVGDELWATVATGYRHACGVRADGTLWCWGHNEDGRLGNGTTDNALEPVQVGTDEDWMEVVTGLDFSCGLRESGAVYCWGDNSYGQLGDGSGVGGPSSSEPVAVDSNDTWIALAAVERGVSRACALNEGGQMYCWGRNVSGAMGDFGPPNFSDVPNYVEGTEDLITIDTGWSHSCGLNEDSLFYCWGSDWQGQLGLQLSIQSIPQLVVP